MGRFDDLFAVFTSRDYKVRFLSARISSTCVVCLKPAVRFLTASSVLEYTVSALCQECQDRYFNKAEGVSTGQHDEYLMDGKQGFVDTVTA
jgi:hypothetical protein